MKIKLKSHCLLAHVSQDGKKLVVTPIGKKRQSPVVLPITALKKIINFSEA